MNEPKTALNFRTAQEKDLTPLIKMLADDLLGTQREIVSEEIDSAYIDAFQAIDTDPNNELIIVELSKQERHNEIIGMLQLTFIPYLSHRGAWRCLIESVRIHKSFRGHGIGTQVFEWAIQEAKNKGCLLVQLTSYKERTKALKFYESLGFKATHEGFKLKLTNQESK